MSFLTESQLKQYGRSTKMFSGYNSLNESLQEFRNESKFFKTKIFLSHKHDEKEYLEGAISFLKSFDVDIYVDWLDGGMPKTTSGETAKRLKDKIKSSDKFILLATEGAVNSKWCNWELGLGDAAKYINNIAILPVKKSYENFSGSEYLDIYPYIFIADSYTELKGRFINKGVYVVYPFLNGDDRIISIEEWLKNN